MAEDDVMHITLTKRDKGQTWASPILGEGQLDPHTTDLEQKRLMLQRFQEEVIIALILDFYNACYAPVFIDAIFIILLNVVVNFTVGLPISSFTFILLHDFGNWSQMLDVIL